MSDAGMKAIEDSLLLIRSGGPAPANLVPFIRAFPSGEKRLQQIQVHPEIYALACKFIAHGGRYLVFINGQGDVELIAATMSNPQTATGQADVVEAAKETVPNGPELPPAVDRLIRTSVEKLDSLQ